MTQMHPQMNADDPQMGADKSGSQMSADKGMPQMNADRAQMHPQIAQIAQTTAHLTTAP